MTFTIKFRTEKQDPDVLSVTWEDGNVYTRGFPKQFILDLFKSYERWPVLLTPTGPTVWKEHIKHPLAFLTVMQNTFYGVRITGDVPLLSHFNPLAVY